jgi:hypothetical protein
MPFSSLVFNTPTGGFVGGCETAKARVYWLSRLEGVLETIFMMF